MLFRSIPNPMPIWTRRTLEHLRGVTSDFFKKPNLVRIAKEVNPAFSNPEVERLLNQLRLDGYLDGTQLLTAKALEALEQTPEVSKPMVVAALDSILEDFSAGLKLPQIATKNGLQETVIEKRLERALEKGELEPSQCISQPRLEQVRLVSEETGFSPLSRLSAALPAFSLLELKAARRLLE